MHASSLKNDREFHWKKIIKIKNIGFNQVEFLMRSTTLKTRVTILSFKKDFVNIAVSRQPVDIRKS